MRAKPKICSLYKELYEYQESNYIFNLIIITLITKFSNLNDWLSITIRNKRKGMPITRAGKKIMLITRLIYYCFFYVEVIQHHSSQLNTMSRLHG